MMTVMMVTTTMMMMMIDGHYDLEEVNYNLLLFSARR